MKNISYFKLQAKNLFRDYKEDFLKSEENYAYAPKFFDINQVVADFDIDDDDFTLMKAQHILALMVGFDSWNDLIKAPESVLEQKKIVLNTSEYKIKEKAKIYRLDLSGYERIADEGKAGDYLIKCPRLPELEEIAKMEPNCYFLSTDADSSALSEDSKHFYVNIVPRTSSIRVLIPGKKYPDWYAVEVRNI